MYVYYVYMITYVTILLYIYKPVVLQPQAGIPVCLAFKVGSMWMSVCACVFVYVSTKHIDDSITNPQKK